MSDDERRDGLAASGAEPGGRAYDEDLPAGIGAASEPGRPGALTHEELEHEIDDEMRDEDA